MAFASSLQEMLLQSHTGTIRIFPAIPSSWKDVSFRTLRTEGAFLVSAAMRDGKVSEVKVRSTVGGPLRVLNTFSRPIEAKGVVCPPGEVHRDIALHADAVQIALYEHLAAVGDAQCVPALFVFRIFSHGHTLGTPPHGCGCQAMK